MGISEYHSKDEDTFGLILLDLYTQSYRINSWSQSAIEALKKSHR